MGALYTVDFIAATNADWLDAFELSDTSGPWNLTGAVINLQVRDGCGRLIIEPSVIITNTVAGQFEVRVPASLMAGVSPGRYLHDAVITQAGVKTRIWEGSVDIAKGVTVT